MSDIERAILGELFNDPTNQFVSSISSDDFLSKKGKEMYEFLDKNRDLRCDFVALTDYVERANLKYVTLEDFASVVGSAISLALIEKHISIQKKVARDYKIKELVNSVSNRFTDDEIEVLHKLTQKNLGDKIEVKSVGDMAVGYPDELARRKELFAQGMLYPTGFESLDDHTGGLMKHNVFVVGGRTSLGKTTFMLNLTTNLMFARDEVRILYFTCEMSPVDLFDRIVSNTGQIEAYKLKYGKINFSAENFEYKRIIEQLSKIHEKKNVNLFYAPSLNIDTVRLAIEKYKPDVAVLDHIQLLKVGGDSRAQAIEDAMYELKGMASEYDLAMIVGSQVSRESEKGDSKRKDMSPIYFKGSGGIEDCASVCCELRLNEKNDKSNPVWLVDLDISKNRFGRVGKLNFNFDRQKLKFMEVKLEQSV